jgi:hypothetical protein
MLSLYADWAKLLGEERNAEILHPDIRNYAAAAIERECIFELVATVNRTGPAYEVPATMGEIVDPGAPRGHRRLPQKRGLQRRGDAFVAAVGRTSRFRTLAEPLCSRSVVERTSNPRSRAKPAPATTCAQRVSRPRRTRPCNPRRVGGGLCPRASERAQHLAPRGVVSACDRGTESLTTQGSQSRHRSSDTTPISDDRWRKS